MSPLKKYLLLCIITGSITGITITVFIYHEAWYFALCAVGGIILAGYLFWKLIGADQNPGFLRLFLTGLFTGSVSHYFCWLLLALIHTICWHLTGGCTDSLGNPPSGITEMLTGAISLSAASLIVCGWFTVPASIISAFTVRWWHHS